MDVSEIVSFKPETSLKRANEEDQDEEKLKKRINKKIVEFDENLVNLNDDDQAEDFDENALKKMLLLFEKRIYKNKELRIKFVDHPEKFLESEVELHSIIQEMHIVSTVPQFYYILVELNTINSMITLLAHENTDISIAIVELIQEMTDMSISESLEDDQTLDSYNLFIDGLLNAQIIQCLVQNMDRLEESIKEESTGIFNSLAIVENLTEIYPDICKEGKSQEELLTWILKRLKLKMPFDANKLYASEILAIFLQNHDGNRTFLGNAGGIDVLLRQLAIYKKHDPESNEEYEYLCNIFDCLGLCLMELENRVKFLQGEGLQLMNLMLREKKQSRCGAIKILNHALLYTTSIPPTYNSNENDNPENLGDKNKKYGEVITQCCNKFVEILGLRTIFPLFMKTPNFVHTSLNKHKGALQKQAAKVIGMSKFEAEEHIISIIASLCRSCTGQARDRFFSKFLEADLSKVDRLVELHFQYLNRVARSDAEIEREKQRLTEEENQIIDEAMEEEFYIRRLGSGLFTLQLIDYIMLVISDAALNPESENLKPIRDRIQNILLLKRGSIKTIKDIILEYAGNLGDAEKDESQLAFQQQLIELINKF